MSPMPASHLVPLPSQLVPNEQDHITDLSFPLGVELCVNLTFFYTIQFCVGGLQFYKATEDMMEGME